MTQLKILSLLGKPIKSFRETLAIGDQYSVSAFTKGPRLDSERELESSWLEKVKITNNQLHMFKVGEEEDYCNAYYSPVRARNLLNSS